MKNALSVLSVIFLLCFGACAQTPAPASAFAATTYSFNLSQITLPGIGTTLAGAEQDMMIKFTPNNNFGESTIIASSPFIGGRYDRTIPKVSNWLQNQTALTGYNYEFYVTGSLGVVKASTNHWGGRAGLGLRWAPSGSTTFSVAFEAQANRLPGIATGWIPSVTIGPQFRF
jgi:hypothetical protein